MDKERLERRRAANRASYERNREKRLARHKKWRQENPERMRVLNAQWYSKNHEKALAARAKYRAEHREELRQLIRAWYEKNKDRVAAAERFRNTGCSDEQYQALLKAQDGKCAICGQVPRTSKLHADRCHATETVRGLLCRACNSVLGFAGDSIRVLNAAVTYLKRNGNA